MLRAALEAQAPPKQSLEAAIDTLSNRLANASLLEDRRSAILGLRSFADQYPATVASKALRALISALGRDVADVDTGKVVLETLLKIVNPKPDSVCAQRSSLHTSTGIDELHSSRLQTKWLFGSRTNSPR